MKLYLDEQDFVQLYALDTDNTDENYVYVSDEYLTEHFEAHYRCYRYQEEGLVYCLEQKEAVKEKEEKDEIREARKRICFPVINRGALWYEKLSEQRKEELAAWYEAWLNAPDTMEMPEAPSWLN
jgi:hypothetical protein